MIVQKFLLGLGYKRVSYFKYKGIILSDVFTSDGFLVVVDRQAIFDTEFSYKLYCQKQNEWMKNFTSVYRFVEDDLEMAMLYLQDSDLDYDDKRTIDRESLMIDPSPLESRFESCFEIVYGSNSFKFLSREYSFLMKNGQTGYMDYALFKKDKSWMLLRKMAFLIIILF